MTEYENLKDFAWTSSIHHPYGLAWGRPMFSQDNGSFYDQKMLQNNTMKVICTLLSIHSCILHRDKLCGQKHRMLLYVIKLPSVSTYFWPYSVILLQNCTENEWQWKYTWDQNLKCFVFAVTLCIGAFFPVSNYSSNCKLWYLMVLDVSS